MYSTTKTVTFVPPLMTAVKKERDVESPLSRFGSKISLRLSLSSALSTAVSVL